MKIFPPFSEMLWPPGLSAPALLWHHRYLLLVMIGVPAGIFASPYLQSNGERTEPQTVQLNAATTQLDGSSCSSLSRQTVNTATQVQPCAPFRIRIGPSITSKKALERANLLSNPGTLTVADRAIVRPQSLRSTVWESSETPPQAPAVALSPKAN